MTAPLKTGWLVNLLNGLFDSKVIVNCDRDPYLLRWYLVRRPSFAIFLHKFIRSDEDRALHDHPWNFIVIPIWRGYVEHSMDAPDTGLPTRFDPRPPRVIQRRVWPIIGTRFRRGTYRHRVELLRTASTPSPAGIFPTDDGVLLMGSSAWKRQVTQELPSWSIFIRFKEWRDWGFWLPEGWVQWNKWWQDKCE